MIITYLLAAIATVLGTSAAVALALAGHWYPAVSLLGLVLISAGCAVAFAKRAPRPTGVAFTALCTAITLAMAGHMAGGGPLDPLWAWVFFAGELATGAAYIDLASRFPLRRPGLRWLALLAYSLTGAIAVAGPLGLLGPVFSTMDPLAIAGRELHYRGLGHSIYGGGVILVNAALTLVGVVVLWSSSRKARQTNEPRIAQQALILIIGTVLCWTPTLSFLPGVLPKGIMPFLNGPPALWFALPPIAGVAALIRPDLHDDRARYRRLLIGTVLVTGAYLLYLALTRFLTLLLDQFQPGFGYEPAVFGAALVVALLFRPIQGWITDRVDQIFFPHLLAFRTLLAETSQALATTIIPNDVSRLATTTLPERLGASGAALLVSDQVGADLISMTGEPVTVSPNHRLWKLAYQADGPTLLWKPDDYAPFEFAAPALMLPLRVGGRLVGIYLLGARQSGIGFTRDELAQLKVLGNHLAVAVENGRSLQKIDELSQRALGEVEERNRLAREIHDTIAQGLTAASLQLDVVEATLTTDPTKAARAAGRAQSIVRDSLAEARRSVLELRAPLLGTESLPAALNRLTTRAASDIGAACSFQLVGLYRGLPARIENQFYRIAQEALHNAVKYSSASHLTVTLRVDDAEAALKVADDGAGFDPNHTAPGNRQGGFGLTGMGERARLLGGHLHIQSEPEAGTQVEVIVPLADVEGELQ